MFYDDDARRRVLEGARQLFEAVKVTMGPKGRNVVISKSYGGPTVTHDGVTVAKAVELDEKDDDTLGYSVGAELIKQAASKMNDVAGDGTTTVTVLTYHILNEANKLIAAGHNPMDLRREVEAASEKALAALKTMREDITAKGDKVAQVASISAGDETIGTMIADVMSKVGKDGVVTVEEGQGLELESEVVEGFNMDRGFVSPYMVTDTARMEASYDRPLVLVTDKKVSSIQEFLPVLEKAAQAGKKDLVLIADDVEGEALGTLVLNKLKGTFNTLAIKAPAFGDRRKAILEDIAILTGATVISEDRGYTFENADLSMLGTARKVIADKDNTTIIEGGGTASDIASRVAQIKGQVENATSEYDKENLEKRVAALEGKVAVIKVGGATETEIEEKKFRVDDAVAATKAALDEGIVAGGGVTLVNIADKLSGKDTGTQLLKEALAKPFLQLMTNAGQNGEVKLAELRAGKAGQGFNVKDTTKLVDMKTSGIVDPARVTREAIQNAVSISSTSMTMGALVVEVPEKDEAPAMPGGGMGGGMPGMM